MRFAIIGCGSIGQRHTHNLVDLEQEVFIFDRDYDKMRDICTFNGFVKPFDPLNKALKFDAYIICTPPEYHTIWAKYAIESNSHVFIEKPISDKRDVSYVAQANERGLKIWVGYQLRFHSKLCALRNQIVKGELGDIKHIRAIFGQNLKTWHPYEDYRNLYTTKCGIILDASHEIDYVLALAPGEVEYLRCTAGRLGDLEMDPGAEDSADISMIVRRKNNTKYTASIHVDCIYPGYVRKCEVIGSKDSAEWVYNSDKIMEAPEDLYKKEMIKFMECIANPAKKPVVTAVQAVKVLEIALTAKECAKWVGI